MKNVKFYKCTTCGQVVMMITDMNNPLTCCGKEMMELVPKSEDEMKGEFHTPLLIKERDKAIIKVGLKPHPSENDHYIKWISLVTNKGTYIKYLKPGDEPKATFLLEKDEEVKEVYSLCNIHLLWTIACNGKISKCKCYKL